LASNVARQAEGVSLSGDVRLAAPAELTRTLTGPTPLSTASIIAPAAAASPRSAAKALAQAKPIPFDPPVTRTTLPSRLSSIAHTSSQVLLQECRRATPADLRRITA
jgi:hypothetical protein